MESEHSVGANQRSSDSLKTATFAETPANTILPNTSIDELKVIQQLLSLVTSTNPETQGHELQRFFSKIVADPPSQIGDYRLLEQIGAGGMGTVYKAAQEKPVKRVVALKVLSLGLTNRELQARFIREYQVLAKMDHTNIAHVFDAGCTPEGQPFFTMEFCSGTTLTDYCDRRRLTLANRIRLFLQVCEGVQHAHQKGIIHRDLKPLNILVVEQNHKPLAKIIDFGIAKITGNCTESMRVTTLNGQVLGTPGYISPEQSDALPEDLDIRVDIYSLGATLFELLIGEPALLLPQDEKLNLAKIMDLIRNHEPGPPSQRFQIQENAEKTAHLRAESATSLGRKLRGDLDWIVAKAMDRDPSRRYASVSDLSADLVRYLNEEPVLACAPTPSYRLYKFLRRNRTWVSVAATGILLLIFLLLSMMVAYLRLSASEQRVNQANQIAILENQKYRRVNEFLLETFSSGNPFTPNGYASLNNLLDGAGERLKALDLDQPLELAALHRALGQSFLGQGLPRQAESHFLKVRDLVSVTLGEWSPEKLEAEMLLGRVAHNRGSYSHAEFLYRQTISSWDQVQYHPGPLRQLMGIYLGHTLLMKDCPDEALELYQLHGFQLGSPAGHPTSRSPKSADRGSRCVGPAGKSRSGRTGLPNSHPSS